MMKPVTQLFLFHFIKQNSHNKNVVCFFFVKKTHILVSSKVITG